MPNFLETIYKQTGIGQSRSSVLNPLQWMLVILIGGLSVVLFSSHTPPWLQVLFAALIGWNVLLITVAYCYFMIREPAILRSEDFSLARTAMDKGLFTAEIASHLLHRENQLKQGKGISVKNLQELKERPQRTRRTSKEGAKTE
jgi:hypothetical protein